MIRNIWLAILISTSVTAQAVTLELLGVRHIKLRDEQGKETEISFDSQTSGSFRGYMCQSAKEEERRKIRGALEDASIHGAPLDLVLTLENGTACLRSVNRSATTP